MSFPIDSFVSKRQDNRDAIASLLTRIRNVAVRERWKSLTQLTYAVGLWSERESAWWVLGVVFYVITTGTTGSPSTVRSNQNDIQKNTMIVMMTSSSDVDRIDIHYRSTTNTGSIGTVFDLF